MRNIYTCVHVCHYYSLTDSSRARDEFKPNESISVVINVIYNKNSLKLSPTVIDIVPVLLLNVGSSSKGDW